MNIPHKDAQIKGVIRPAGRASSWLKPFLPWVAVSIFLGLFFFYPLSRILWLGLNPTALKTLDTSSLQLVVRSLLFTFYQAGLSTILTLLLGLPAAVLFARYDFRGKVHPAPPHGHSLHAAHGGGRCRIQCPFRSQRMA